MSPPELANAMPFDLTSVFREWPFDGEDDTRNVRCVRGHDGRLKIQVRARSALFQWEYEGRPDGARPHGFPSLLDYYRQRVADAAAEPAAAPPLQLSQAEVEAIGEELTDYYQRRVLFFRLGEYERARGDAEHNLALMDLLRTHAGDPEGAAEHEKWRPFVLMDRTRADALLTCQQGDHLGGVRKVEEGIGQIADFFRHHGREDLVAQCQEIAVLRDLQYQLRELYHLPLSHHEVLEGLREEQARAIADEDFERADRIRDEIDLYESDSGTDRV